MLLPIQDIQLINYIKSRRNIKNPKKLYKINVVGNKYFTKLPNKLKNYSIIIENDYLNKHDKNALLVKYKVGNTIESIGYIPKNTINDFRMIKNKLKYLGIARYNDTIVIIGELK